MVDMYERTSTSSTRRRRLGLPCVCFKCGVEVYPPPLEILPDSNIVRGHPIVAVVVNKRTQQIHLQPRLLCPVCANLDVKHDEPTASK